MDLELSDWLEQTQERRDELAEYGGSPLPIEPGQRHSEMEKAIAAADDADRLLADAESFLSQTREQAVFSIRERHPDLTSREREVLERARVREVQRLVDGAAATARTIRSRIFAIQNQNRAR